MSAVSGGAAAAAGAGAEDAAGGGEARTAATAADADADAGAPAARWDARYAAAAAPFGDAPTLWLRMMAARPDFAPRTALMLADGDGRNGTWLAAQGLAVTAVDLSATGTRRARERDAAAGVAVRRIAADLARWTPPAGRRWDLATVLCLHAPGPVRARAVATAAAALAPGGWLLVEGFATAQAAAAMGPDDPDKLWDLAALAAAAEAAGLGVVEALEGRVLLDEGDWHRGTAAMVRLAARRP